MNSDQATELNRAAKAIKNDVIKMNALWLKGWAKVYVESETPIPKDWYDDFLDELTEKDEDYRHALEESVRYFGVRWS